jgi:hypothetical protein
MAHVKFWKTQLRLIVLLATFVVVCVILASRQTHIITQYAPLATWVPTSLVTNFTGVSATALEKAQIALEERIREIRQRQRDLSPDIGFSLKSNETSASVSSIPKQRTVLRTTRILTAKTKQFWYTLSCSNGIKINCTYPPLSRINAQQGAEGENLALVPSTARLLVISPGGVGTSFLMQHLRRLAVRSGKILNNMHDTDGLKHMLFNNLTECKLQCFQPSAILYVFDHPAAVIHSHIRREWAAAQYTKLNGVPTAWRASSQELRWLVGCPANYSKQVIATQQDIFGVERHMMSWVNASINVPMQFMTTQAAMQSSKELGSLFGIMPAHLQFLYDKWKPTRSYDPAQYDPEYVQFYDKVFDRMVQYNYYKKEVMQK